MKHHRARSPRRGATVPSVQAVLKAVPHTDRCRATHDVPYTLRCVLEASHTVPAVLANRPGYTMVREHEDKDGRRW